MASTIIDPSLYCYIHGEELIDINRTFIDELLRAEADQCKTQNYGALERFETSGNEYPLFTFAGMH